MRLVALTTSFPLHKDACTGVFVRRLYEHLPEPWRVEVICPDDDAVQPPEVEESRRIRLRPVRYAPRRWQTLAQRSGGMAARMSEVPWQTVLVPALLAALWWRSLSLARRADLLHANWAVCGAIAAFAAALVRRPLVTTLRGDDVTRAERSILDRRLLDSAVRGSVAVVCVSDAMAVKLRALYPSRAEDIHVCLNGVDSSFLTVVRSMPESGRLRVAAVGSLIQRKGYDMLIEAIARMRHRDAVTLKIAGAGPELSALRWRAARLGVDDRIHLVGEIPPAHVPQFLADADIFVLPSRSEGRPNVVVEALAAGLPVVSTDLPGAVDLVNPGVNGWRVAVDDVAGFALALDDACAHPEERERRAAAARAGILRNGCDWAATGECYDTLFSQVVERRSGAPT